MPVGTDLFDPSHEVRRVVDRLRTVAPRIQPAQVCVVRDALEWMVEVCAVATDVPTRHLPQVKPHALADQVRVLAHDVLRDAPHLGGELTQRLTAVRRQL